MSAEEDGGLLFYSAREREEQADSTGRCQSSSTDPEAHRQLECDAQEGSGLFRKEAFLPPCPAPDLKMRAL